MSRKTIYYDGSCPMCMSIIKKVDASSEKGKFDPKDITKDSLPQNITKTAAMKEIHVVDEEGRVYKNAEAILQILDEYPKWKFLVKIGRLPIIKHLLPIGYRFIASHRHSLFNPSKKKGPDALIIFIFIYILVAYPITFFTKEELFPLSRFPMYAQNTLQPCGYQIRTIGGDRPVVFEKKEGAFNLFLKYSREVIERKSSSNAEMCQFIKEVFWPDNLPHDPFYIKKYCTNIKDLPSMVSGEGVVLSCR